MLLSNDIVNLNEILKDMSYQGPPAGSDLSRMKRIHNQAYVSGEVLDRYSYNREVFLRIIINQAQQLSQGMLYPQLEAHYAPDRDALLIRCSGFSEEQELAPKAAPIPVYPFQYAVTDSWTYKNEALQEAEAQIREDSIKQAVKDAGLDEEMLDIII